jgi:hypothetical protein
MGNETQKLLVDSVTEMRERVIENNAAIRELRGEFREFKIGVTGRVEGLERKEGERNKNVWSLLSLLVSAAALAVTVIVNFFRHGGR